MFFLNHAHCVNTRHPLHFPQRGSCLYAAHKVVSSWQRYLSVTVFVAFLCSLATMTKHHVGDSACWVGMDPVKAKQPLSHAYSPMDNKCLWFCRCRRIGYAAEGPIGTMLLWKFWSQGGCRGKSPLTVTLWEAQGSAQCSNIILDGPHTQ